LPKYSFISFSLFLLQAECEARLEASKESMASAAAEAQAATEAARANDRLEVDAAVASAKEEVEKVAAEQARQAAEFQGKIRKVEAELAAEKEQAAERKKQVIAHVGTLNEAKQKLTGQLGRAKQLLEEAQKREHDLKAQIAAQEGAAVSSQSEVGQQVWRL
jgi:chromosome segregation ATPase